MVTGIVAGIVIDNTVIEPCLRRNSQRATVLANNVPMKGASHLGEYVMEMKSQDSNSSTAAFETRVGWDQLSYQNSHPLTVRYATSPGKHTDFSGTAAAAGMSRRGLLAHVGGATAAATASAAGAETSTASRPGDDVLFATFNIQKFGKKKAARSAVMDALASTLARFDIVAIQEVSQPPKGNGVCGENTMSAICDLLAKVRSVSQRDFAVVASPRIGDEQYVMMYDKNKAIYKNGVTYPDANEKHIRPPHAFLFTISNKDFVFAVTHTQPSKAKQEIKIFPM
jgi:hypothetical protein